MIRKAQNPIVNTEQDHIVMDALRKYFGGDAIVLIVNHGLAAPYDERVSINRSFEVGPLGELNVSYRPLEDELSIIAFGNRRLVLYGGKMPDSVSDWFGLGRFALTLAEHEIQAMLDKASSGKGI